MPTSLSYVPCMREGEANYCGVKTLITGGDMVEMVRAKTATNKPVETEAARIRPKDSEVRALLADATQFREATGWAARVSLEEGLERTIAWWGERKASGQVRAHDAYLL